MIDYHLFGLVLRACFILSISIQLSFFIIAVLRKTDIVTDLAYGLSFVVICWWLALKFSPLSPIAAAAVTMVTLWGIRLAGYLFMRILAMGQDKRFNGIRENSFRFGVFWLLQAFSIWFILTPTLLAVSHQPFTTLQLLHWLGIATWALGLCFESISDWQKFHFKSQPENTKKLVTFGLWKYSRHPNYFGELLCWWGIFLLVVPQLSGWGWLLILSPLYITGLLLFGTGIPTLEKKYNLRYKHDATYQTYRRKTSLLIPLPPRP